MTCVVIAVCALLATPGAPRAAAYISPAYDAKIAPLDDLSRELLTGNGYALNEDGRVWDKINESAVARDDMPFLLSRLASARRLRALLQINAVITRYDSEKNLTPQDKEAVRELVRQNWIVFGIVPRRDFRPYFSLQELESLDRIPPRFEKMSAVLMTDPAIDSPTAAPPPTALPVVPATVKPWLPTLSTPELGVFRPWTPPVVSSAAAVTAPPPSPATIAVATVAVVTPPVVPAIATTTAITPAPQPPAPAVLTAADYEEFVANGPYSKEGRALLELIGKRAPDFCLPLLHRTVVGLIPQIVFDGSRTGASLRAGLVHDVANPLTPPTITLSPGPVMVSVKKGLFAERSDTLLPESLQAWSELGVARPDLDAFATEKTPSSVENGPWGSVRVYPDASRRGTYSTFEQAGELLEQILLLGLAQEGFNSSPYAARRWARTARLLFSARLQEEFGQVAFLDPDRRTELGGWRDRSAEEDDLTIASWAGSRVQIYDPRRGPPLAERARNQRQDSDCSREALVASLVEAARRRARRVGILETLIEVKLIDPNSAKESAKIAEAEEATARARLTSSPPACATSSTDRAEGLRRSGLIAAEAARVERAWRESKREGDSHAR